MSRPPKMPRSALLDLLTDVILNKGYAGSSLADFSKASGLSKASLYHFFPDGKKEIARQCLARSGMKLQRLVISPLQGRALAAKRLEGSFAGILRYYDGSAPSCLMNLLGIGDDSDEFRADIAAGMAAWQQALRDVLMASGFGDKHASATADSILEQIQGSLVLCRISASRAPLEKTIDRLRADLELASVG